MTSHSGDVSSRLGSCGGAEKEAIGNERQLGDDSVFCPPPDYDTADGKDEERRDGGGLNPDGKPAGGLTRLRQPYRRGSQEWEVLRELRFAVSSSSGSTHFQQQQQQQQQNSELAQALRDRELRRRRLSEAACASGCCEGSELYAKFREIRAKSEAAKSAAAARESDVKGTSGGARVATLVQKFQQQQQQH